MSKPICIFRHVDCEGPGYLIDVLERRGIPFKIIRIDQGDSLPRQLHDYSALVFMGGPMSVNDDLPWIQQELDLIRSAVKTRMPLLGHCLGGQLISKAMGGHISANPVKEIGWLSVSTVVSQTASQWLGDGASGHLLFHWHGETFSLPQGATLILRSRHCDHQAFVKGNILALQCHIEMTADMVREWVGRFPQELTPETETVQGAETILEDLEKKIADLQSVADTLYENWLDHLKV